MARHDPHDHAGRKDRLRHMNEKNPLLAELRRELDLEVE